MFRMRKKSGSEWLWDLWCLASVVGIWPRFIEPKLLAITRLSLPISHLPVDLVGLKILHFSDLHWSARFYPSLLKKLVHKINHLQPDLILFTGDILCRSKLERTEELKQFLCSLKSRFGCFAVLGNHDYEQFITINEKGDYDVEALSTTPDIVKGFKRLLRPVQLTKIITPSAQAVKWHLPLIQLFKDTPFQLLNNSSQLVPCRHSFINICGVEEYTTGHINVQQAFRHYHPSYPGIILSHNPDAIPHLLSCPGDIILSGHTHGGQVNLPGMWKKFTMMENFHLKRGLKKLNQKWIYINRGIGSVMQFRWFSTPELTLITLETEKETK